MSHAGKPNASQQVPTSTPKDTKRCPATLIFGLHSTCVDGLHNCTCSCEHGCHSVTTNGKTCVDVTKCDARRRAAACSPGTCIDMVNGFPGACQYGSYLIMSPDVNKERREREVRSIAPVSRNAMHDLTSKTSCEGIVKYTCDRGYTTLGTTDGPTKWIITCLVGGVFSESCAYKPVA